MKGGGWRGGLISKGKKTSDTEMSWFIHTTRRNLLGYFSLTNKLF
jgi:hypothetical protein